MRCFIFQQLCLDDSATQWLDDSKENIDVIPIIVLIDVILEVSLMLQLASAVEGLSMLPQAEM